MKPVIYAATRLTPAALSKALIGFIALVCLSLILATAWQLYHSSVERLNTANAAASNIASAAEQQAHDTFNQADNALRNIVERVEYDGTNGTQQTRLATVMVEIARNNDSIQGLFVYDAQGNWVANSFSQGIALKNNSDRAYFLYHRDNTDAAIHISSIVESRTTGDLIIPVSRRIENPDGSFAGVALATIPVAHFKRFFDRMNFDNDGVILLAMGNGDLLARRPEPESLATTNIAKGEIFSIYLPRHDSGTAMLRSVVDRVERIYAYQRVSGLPLVVAAGISKQYVFVPWWNYAYRSLIIVGLIILALCILGILLYRQIQHLILAESDLEEARQDLEILAKTDGLTQLANRRSFDAALQKEWTRGHRNNSSLAIVLLDIDWFKQYNDRYGHLQGDDCLRQVALIISQSANRATDLAARYGGEEFVILLPDTDLAGALEVAETVRKAIYDAFMEHSASPLGRVTISSGVVATKVLEKNNVEEALAEADRRLYTAKSLGRNRVAGALDPVHGQAVCG